MIDSETAEKMYIEQYELLNKSLKEQIRVAKNDHIRLFLHFVEVGSLFAIALYLWSN